MSIMDEDLVRTIEKIKNAPKTGFVTVPAGWMRDILGHTLELRNGIRTMAEFFPYDGEERQNMLRLIGEEMVSPTPKTSEEKIAFRKEWDRRVEEHK